ncbi:MAG TPA: hypothetical protein VF876_03575 [Burkholderiales bacterium]
MNRGLLLTMTEPPPAMEEEFNAWYDDEHMAERLAVPGFRSARRWVADCRPGEGKYLATYETDSPAVLTSEVYLARLNNPTPWSKRSLKHCVVFRRWVCEQLHPGMADPDPRTRALLFCAGDAPYEKAVAGALQARRFMDPQGKPRHVTLVELAAPIPLPRDAGWEFRLYRAYP